MNPSFTFLLCTILAGPAFAQRSTRTVAELLAESKNSALRGSGALDEQWIPAASAEGQQVANVQVEKTFLAEVEAALGTHVSKKSRKRVADIIKDLQSTFDSLDKNEYGKLGHTAVRYALHRLFVARHGWLIKGLDPAGEHFSTSSPIQALQNKTSVHVQGIFEKRLGGKGFGLQELAAFASVLETLISNEVSERVQLLSKKLRTPSFMMPATVTRMLDVYMSAYILGTDLNNVTSTADQLLSDMEQMGELYSYWKEAKQLVRDVRKEILGTRRHFLSIKDISAVLVEVGERFGKWQNTECQQMKDRLVKLERGETGCVPLSSFYKGMLTSSGTDWQFGENLDYLKESGVIDESDPQDLKLLVANYMASPANCIATSKYYSVCCISECEHLLSQIEVHARSSTATPAEIIAVVAALPSSSVPANRTLPPSQIHRLTRIAEKHDGRVPLHGRLFMQWLHMVYPRECPYPHVSGSFKPTAYVWANSDVGIYTPVTDQEMERFVKAPETSRSGQPEGQCGRWVDEEEIYAGGPISHKRSLRELETDFHTWVATASVALLCVAAATMLAVIHTFKSVKKALCGGKRPLMLV